MNRPCLPIAAALLLSGALSAQERAHLELDSPFASYVEKDFPFFTQTVDAREFGETPEKDNLTPRGIVVAVGNGFHGCFDPDLLRWALFWKENGDGEFLTMNGMGAGSYRLPNRKSPPGQTDLPKPLGAPLLSMPLRPGAFAGTVPLLEDPRDRGVAEEGETGLGALPPAMGRFLGLRLVGGFVQVEYRIADGVVKERLSGAGAQLFREIEVAAHGQPLGIFTGPGDTDWIAIPPSPEPTRRRVVISETGSVVAETAPPFPAATSPGRRWPDPVMADPAIPPAKDAAWVFDDLPLPIPNPWKRNVRVADLAFFPEGRAALVTFDGDVWIADGLGKNDGASWSRFASGLHEPQNLAIRDGQILVFDRNGIVALHDTDGNGEADWHENISNGFAQSAETRQYANDFIARPDGAFDVAIGGQVGSTIGKLNGTVIRIAPDGDSYQILATGLRQPYLGYDERTDLLTASDQQGNWKPATPIYRIKEGRYFGFQPEKYKGEVTHPAPIAPPEVWIPHFVNQSGASQVWIRQSGAIPPRMGPLNDTLVHIGYNRPELFRIYLDPAGEQGAVMPLVAGFPPGLLNGRVNPVDGLLYVAGFQIFSCSGSRTSGVFRVRPGGVKAWLPRAIRAEKRGLLVSFDDPLSPDLAGELGRYSADRWNYTQTHVYGSGNYRLDGEPGQDALPVLSAKLSEDKKSLFLGIADMRPSHSLRLTYRIPAPEVTQVENAYLTVHSLPSFDLKTIGFADDRVDLTPRTDLTGAAAVEPTAALGKEVAMRYGCVACHATGDPDIPAPPVPAGGGTKLAVGPPWIGLWGSRKRFSDGSELRSVDGAYLRESILDPARRVQEGFEMERTGVGMPSYLGVLKDHEIESVVMFIQGLGKK